MEGTDFGSDEMEFAYLETTASLIDVCSSGVYEGDAAGVYLDASGWKPGADYVITERGWYQEGLNHEEFAFGMPYVDAESGEMVVSASALLNRSDRKNMVAAIDVFLSDAGKIVSDIDVMGTQSGYGFVVDASSNMIIFHKDSSWNATEISTEHSDPMMARIAGMLGQADGSVQLLEGNGLDNYVTLTPIEGTNWVLVISVSRQEVLAELYNMIYYYIAVAVISIVIASLLLAKVIGSTMKPVKRLTDNLTQIADGDFTVDIECKGNDEIARMSMALRHYIEMMRTIIQDINAVSGKLDVNAVHGKSSAEVLSVTAEEQQQSMQNMQQAVDDLARSVSELAGDATSLAEIVDMAAISEEQSASAEEVLATIEMLTQNSSRITEESKGMEESSEVVADSAVTLVDYMKYFRV